jgi:L-amino acid N-acyltransferase YncA
MSLFPELLDDKFPFEKTLPSGLKIQVRNLNPADKDRLWAFFREIPVQDKLYLQEDLSVPEVAEEWCNNLDYCSMMPVVALSEDKIIGYVILRHESRSWKRHMGMVRLVVHPDFRQKGIASFLLHQIIDLAMHCGLEKLQAEFMAEQEIAIRLFEHSGFVTVATVPRMVIDMNGKSHDFILMVYNMRDVERHAAD